MSVEIPDNKAETQRGRPKKGARLYDMEENDEGGFDVVMPALVNSEGHIAGTWVTNFETQQEAEEAIEASEKERAETYERISLEKTFTPSFFRIDETEDGNFVVTFPGLKDLKKGHYVGYCKKEFPSWDEAKEFYLKTLEDESSLTKDPIVELQISDSEQIAFSDFDNFRPNVAPSKETREIPPAIQKYMLKQEKVAEEDPNASTYQETIAEDGWEDKIFTFVSSYLEQHGQQIVEELRIKKLDAMSPRQATELSTRIVVELTKYNYSASAAAKKSSHLDASQKIKADQSTTLTLLKEGLSSRENEEWEGNGVCRNFASMTKAVFEALKAKQTEYSRLRDTYCLYESGSEGYKPKPEDRSNFSLNQTGHAWNTFMTISDTKANATIIDTTWAKRNLDTGDIEGLDHTLTRMEPIVNQIAGDIPLDSPDREEQLKHVLAYYLLKMEKGSQRKSKAPSIDTLESPQRAYYMSAARRKYGQQIDLDGINDDELVKMGLQISVDAKNQEVSDEENSFFSTRVVRMLRKEKLMPEIAPELLSIIEGRYKALGNEVEIDDIQTLWKISKRNSDLKFNEILVTYLQDLRMSNYNCRDFMSYDDELQIIIYEHIKDDPRFDAFLKDSSEFRSRMRKVLPGLFIDFSPGTKDEDLEELRYIISESNLLRSSAYLFVAGKVDEAKINKFFLDIRKKLEKLNPEEYQKTAGDLDDSSVVRIYDSLYAQLKGK